MSVVAESTLRGIVNCTDLGLLTTAFFATLPNARFDSDGKKNSSISDHEIVLLHASVPQWAAAKTQSADSFTYSALS
jgi:hypothetical protein